MQSPPLPKIHSGDLTLEVFKHKSLQSDQSDAPTNEGNGGSLRLAELGQKVLHMAITSCLFSKRPMLKASDIAKRCEELISEKKLEEWCSSYKLTSKLVCLPAKAEEVKKPEETRVLFCSYIGAVFVESGLTPIQEWISLIINPNDVPPQQPTPPPPPLPATMNQLAFFNQLATQRGLAVTYPAESTGPSHQPRWTVQCMINGVEKGRGVGKNQKIAREEAAKQALNVMGWV